MAANEVHAKQSAERFNPFPGITSQDANITRRKQANHEMIVKEARESNRVPGNKGEGKQAAEIQADFAQPIA